MQSLFFFLTITLFPVLSRALLAVILPLESQLESEKKQEIQQSNFTG